MSKKKEGGGEGRIRAQDISGKELERAVKNRVRNVTLFYSPECPSCHEFEPVFQKSLNTVKDFVKHDKVQVFKLNATENAKAIENLGLKINGYPTLIAFGIGDKGDEKMEVKLPMEPVALGYQIVNAVSGMGLRGRKMKQQFQEEARLKMPDFHQQLTVSSIVFHRLKNKKK